MNKDNSNKLLDYEVDSTIESKLMANLQWSMLFFIFNRISKNNRESDLSKEFFRGWKKFASEHVVKKDLQTINAVLNSPKNMFHSLLQNKDETIDSTEIYQEKYNKIMKSVENFYFNSINTQNSEDDN
jgi:hypothetical protein